MRKVFPLVLLFVLALPTYAAKYYIDPNLGVDSHTRAQAKISYLSWRHIQTGIDSAAAGDTLSLTDGTYAESITITKKLAIIGRINTVSIIRYPGAGSGTVVTLASGADGVLLKNLSIDGRYQFGNGALNGIWCNAGVDSLWLIACAVRNCGASGLHTSFDGTPDGAVNNGFRIESCFFQNILDGEGTALHSCCVWGDHLSHAYIRGNAFEQSGIGLWLSGSALPDSSAGTGNVVNSNVMQDLTQNALAVSGLYNTVIDSNIMRRCAGFAVPDSAWSRTNVGAVSFTGGAVNVTMAYNTVRDNIGFLGRDTFYTDPLPDTTEKPAYSGWPGIFFRGADTVSILHCSIFDNNCGGIYISGPLPKILIDSCFLYYNGDLNDTGGDYGVSARFARVDARNNWWGADAGPIFDGSGIGNGVYGDSVLYRPVMGNSIYTLKYNPQRIIFLIVHIGQYEDTTFDFYNAGPGPAFTAAPFIGGPAASQFAIVRPTSPQIIEPFDTLHVTVHFQPTEVGLLEAVAAIQTDTSALPFGPQLYGFGGLAVLTTSDTIAFDTVAPGRCATKFLPVNSIGTEVAGVANVSIIGPDSADFSMPDSLPVFIPGGYTDNLHVDFCPHSVGKKTATLILNANTFPVQTLVHLTGASSTVSRLVPDVTTVALGKILLGAHADSVVFVRNTASRQMDIDSVYFDNDARGEFSLRSPALPDTIGVGYSTLLRFRFLPSIRGVKNVTLRAVCGDGTQFVVNISGYGGVIQLTKAADTLFGNVNVPPNSADTEQCLMVTNTGDFPAGVLLAAVVGPRKQDYNLIPFRNGTMAPGATDTVCVDYHPTQLGFSPAYIVLQYTDPALPLDTAFLAGRSGSTGVSENPEAADAAALDNYPNPFSEATTIAFHVAEPGAMTLKIYNILGVQVASLVSGYVSSGDHAIPWNAGDLPRGIYFCRGSLDGKVYARALNVVK